MIVDSSSWWDEGVEVPKIDHELAGPATWLRGHPSVFDTDHDETLHFAETGSGVTRCGTAGDFTQDVLFENVPMGYTSLTLLEKRAVVMGVALRACGLVNVNHWDTSRARWMRRGGPSGRVRIRSSGTAFTARCDGRRSSRIARSPSAPCRAHRPGTDRRRLSSAASASACRSTGLVSPFDSSAS